MATHRMIWNQTAHFGPGSVAVVPAELDGRGFTKALVVTDPVLVDTGVTARVTDLLDAAGFPYELFADVAPNPSIENVQAGVAAFAGGGRRRADRDRRRLAAGHLQGVGIIIANPEFADVRSLEGGAATTHPSVPIIAIPTTAGTASETTINYVITDTERQRKFVCVDPHDIPVVAVVDAEMMATAPRSLKVATGLDALTHAIEGYLTAGAWELSDLFHLKAIQVIAGVAAGRRRRGRRRHGADGPRAVRGRHGVLQRRPRPGARDGPPARRVLLRAARCRQRHPAGPGHGVQRRGDGREASATSPRPSASRTRPTMPLDDVRTAAVEAVAALTRALGNPTRISEVGATEADLPALAKVGVRRRLRRRQPASGEHRARSRRCTARCSDTTPRRAGSGCSGQDRR